MVTGGRASKSWARIYTLAAALTAAASPLRAEEISGSLNKIKDTGTITLGVRDAAVPFSYLDGDQRPIGYAIDICYKIADAVKVKLGLSKLDIKLFPVTSATRIPLIIDGTIDLECGATTINAERQKYVAFTDAYFVTATRYLAKKGSNLHTVEDLKGKTVVSTLGTTNLTRLREANATDNLGLNIITAPDHAEAFFAVQSGRAAAFAMDDVLLASLAASAKYPDDYTISADTLSKPEPYGIMLRKDDKPFKAVVDAATFALLHSPEGKMLYNKWFTKPIPPRGINLRLPMSEELKERLKTSIDKSNIAVLSKPTILSADEQIKVEPQKRTDKRVALVIGNSAYQHADKLANPTVDARNMRDALRKLNFNVVYGEDLDHRALHRIIGTFADAVDGADVAIVYFAGHGATFSDTPYVVPVDAEFSSLGDIPYELVPVETLIGELRRAKGIRIAILDACRDNSAERELKRTTSRGVGASRGLARVRDPDGLIIAYGTQYLSTAADGDPNGDSPFTAALLKRIAIPGIDVKEMFFEVANDVIASTGGKQRPEISISLYDRYSLAP